MSGLLPVACDVRAFSRLPCSLLATLPPSLAPGLYLSTPRFPGPLSILPQAEVFNGAILQQTFVVDYIVENNMCPDCNRQNANPNSWNACVQVGGIPGIGVWGRG